MTREEAKEILTHNWTRVDNPNYSESELDEAFFMAIEALSADTVSFETQVESTRQVLDDFAKDRVKVVRCKDCKWWNYGEDCVRHTEDTMGYTISTTAYDFCSYGERKK